MKSQVEAFRQDGRGDEIALACIRMLQDCPSHSSSRRELLVVMRHLMNAPSRRAVVPHINKLLSEKVLLGQAVGSQEILRYVTFFLLMTQLGHLMNTPFRPFAYNVTGEFIHQIRAELSFTQLTRYAETYASLMHNPHMVLAGQLVAVRMFCPMVDMILTKESPDTVAALITFMAQTLAEKAAAIVAQAEYVVERMEKQKRGDTSPDISTIEKERPIANASYASEAPEDIMRGMVS
jgi:transformation/transcription domain-associated protein